MRDSEFANKTTGSFSLWLAETALIIVLLGSLFLLWQLDPWGWRGGAQHEGVASQWQKALNFIEIRDFSEAKTHLARCLEISPFNAEAQFLMAQTCRRADDAEEWFHHLGHAQALLWPLDQIELEQRLAEAQFGNIWGVEDQLRQEVPQAPPFAKVMIVEAMIKGFLDNERPKEAYRLARAWTEDYPDDWVGWLLLARTCQLGTLFAEAIEGYQRSLELKSDQPQTHLWLADTLFSQAEFDKAEAHYRCYLQSHPDDPDGLVGLGRCQYSLGQVDLARSTLDQLLSQHEKHALGLLTRAQLEQAEAPERALPWLRRAEVVAPNEPEILHNLAMVLNALNRKQQAREYEQRMKDRQAKVRQLMELQMQLVGGASNALEMRYQIGLLNLELGKPQEADHWFQTVLWIDPNHRPTLQALADYWEKRGDPARAANLRARVEGKHPPVDLLPGAR